MEVELDELLAISPELSPPQQARFTEVLRELERQKAQDALHLGRCDQKDIYAARPCPRLSTTLAVA